MDIFKSSVWISIVLGAAIFWLTIEKLATNEAISLSLLPLLAWFIIYAAFRLEE